ncbi:hypothetical protein [Sedimenticola hydrogenitrophicus]|uniref:hypothetical protein n=1 Tax=Sedimenticola hydrogenitrophicus TaxID=2967975 RepID=UPI0021A4A724|nr:hypothetical protein [Sedimenticola hydrogenitrophicus]
MIDAEDSLGYAALGCCRVLEAWCLCAANPTYETVSDWPALLADLDGASNQAPFSDSSLRLFERSEFGQALKKGPDSRKQAIV